MDQRHKSPHEAGSGNAAGVANSGAIIAKNSRCKEANALLAVWSKTYPAFADYKPLAIGIRDRLIAAHPNIDRDIICLALRFRVKARRYLQALSEGEARHNLDGSVAGEVTAEHRGIAKAQLEAKLAKDRQKSGKPRKRAKAWDSLKPPNPVILILACKASIFGCALTVECGLASQNENCCT